MQIWYCGGIDGANTQTIDDCLTYDITSDAWDTSTPPPMPAGRNHAATCSDGASMWVFGGRSGKNVVGEGFADTQIYSGGAWSQGTPLPFGRGGMGKAVFWEGKCYVFGGEVWTEHSPIPDKPNAVDAQQTVYSVDVYDTATDTWSRGAVRHPSFTFLAHCFVLTAPPCAQTRAEQLLRSAACCRIFQRACTASSRSSMRVACT